ncbi:MAG TPA: hypothetical protein G4N94_01075 [Caldilineae bacterium]|nr:hypothetical protein [Caldilineae bacterium]
MSWLPAFLFLLALLSDFFDGYLARRSDHVTQLGQALDMAIDGMGVLLAALLVIVWGQWPAIFAIVGLAAIFLSGG